MTGRRLDVDPELVRVRGMFGMALRHHDEEAAAELARRLVRIRRRLDIARKERELAELRAVEGGKTR